ncbi:MAG: UDP-N-acetylmuramoyl-L-alanine--D-glutamate ligase [Thermodesulfovibrionales bacterium]|nr:UDP-N-acetylmuramoyl-L-alanine--D-glutamate ligase [Thermodesulfovibrionales bacterium]
MEIRDKKVTVVGLGRSGIGAANLLSEIGSEVTVTDSKTEDGLKDFIARLNPSVRLALEGHPEDLFVSTDMLVVSPGVPLDILPISKAKEKRIPIIGELELAYQIIRNSKFEIRNSKLLAVTGTNGKSTTTTLLNLILRKGGFRTIIGGNIGSALTEEILKLVKSQESSASGGVSSQKTLDYIVAEVSSFQLESIKDFRPKVAAILNITPDHLDRYHSLEEYMDAKARIFENQREDDFLVLNADDPVIMKVKSEKLKVKSERPRVLYFSRKQEVNGVYFKDGGICCNLPPMTGIVPILPPLAGKSGTVPSAPLPLIRADEIKIKGVHNLENAMAASAMALLADCPLDAVIDSLREFHGLEHRLEFVREINGVRYFNDSKGTNVGAVTKSLGSFTEPIILIAGGRDKSGDFSPLRDLVKEKVKALVLIGEAGEKIKRSLGDLTETVMAKDLKESVNISRNMAVKGNVILLSPACASFDMFLDFEDRGKQFKKIVMEMT